MKKKQVSFRPPARFHVITVQGEERERFNPGLSDEALAKIERYEESSRRAMANLGRIRLH